MANKISILIQADDQATSTLKKVSSEIDGTSGSASNQSTVMQRLSANWSTFAAISAGAGVALYGVMGQLSRANDEAIKLQSSLTGLNSVARAFNQDAGAAKRAAQDLARDGLMTVTDAATGLKNLLASGYNLDQSIALMKRFKDSAAFGRQSALSFGQAVSSATEGIKNGNSILVDNAGVTKNLSVILTEAGYSANDVMKATTDAGVRMALFNGILKETNPQLGDAARLADSAAGKQAQMAAQTTVLYQQIGTALQPAILSLLQTLTPIIVGLANWVSTHQELAAALIIGTALVLGLVTIMGTLATAIVATRTVMMTFGPAASASVAMASSAFTGFQALVASPIAMPALIVAAALASIALVVTAIYEAKGALDALNNTAAAETSAANAEADLVRRARNYYRDPNASASQKAWAANTLGLSGRAMGGPVAQGTSYLVGEHGPEVFTPSTSGTIDRGGGGDTHITISGTINIATPEAAESFWNRIDKTQRLAKVGMA